MKKLWVIVAVLFAVQTSVFAGAKRPPSNSTYPATEYDFNPSGNAADSSEQENVQCVSRSDWNDIAVLTAIVLEE